ncbi:hypothetical protein M6B38_403100 [Iris pallida]|uniref:Uncharacterized protein n=1 Tax=Iris pallida TaxID=29817 RepID=A0AAX6FTG2_IRIPA|nr:hypothetical protein M6B38_403100 [Iris pallida]
MTCESSPRRCGGDSFSGDRIIFSDDLTSISNDRTSTSSRRSMSSSFDERSKSRGPEFASGRKFTYLTGGDASLIQSDFWFRLFVSRVCVHILSSVRARCAFLSSLFACPMLSMFRHCVRNHG